MIFTRKSPVRSLFAVPVCILLLLQILSPSLVEARTRKAAATYDGETIYKGVFLGYGPVANQIPEIRDQLKLEYFITDSRVRDKFVAQYDRVLAQIKVIDPGFFTRFARVMKGGDHVAIKQALQEAGEITIDAVLQLPEFKAAIETLRNDPSPVADAIARHNETVDAAHQVDFAEVEKVINSLSNNDQKLALVWICATFVVAVVWVVAAVDVAVVTSAAVAISLWLAIGVERYVAGPSKAVAQGGDVLTEGIVNSIAVNLSTEVAAAGATGVLKR